MTLICMLETFMLTFISVNNLLLQFMLIITLCFFVCILQKKYTIYNIVIPILLMACLIISLIISSIVSCVIFQIPFYNVLNSLYVFLFQCILSRILFIFLCRLIAKYENQFDLIIFKKYNWFSFMMVSLSLVSILTFIYESIIYNKILMNRLYIIIVLLLILTIAMFYFYTNTKVNYRLYIETSTQLLKEQYSKEMYQKTKDLSYKILLDKHEMYYNLLHIQNCICNKREKEALKFINQKIDQYKAYELSSLTHNPIFDYQILGYINELRQMGYDIKPIITCQNNHSLERMEIIDFMKEAIDVFVEYTQDSKRFEIYLYVKNSVLILKMSADKQNVNLKKINTENLDYISQMEVIENSIGETELRVIFQ